jgi:DNA polymerase-3 subunit delta
MVAFKAAQVDSFVARPNPAQPIVLVYGPDAGLVRERAEALIRIAVDNPNDPFSLARLEGDELAGEPTRLVEEANTIPLFGDRRAVWVKAGARNFVAAVEALAAAASQYRSAAAWFFPDASSRVSLPCCLGRLGLFGAS